MWRSQCERTIGGISDVRKEDMSQSFTPVETMESILCVGSACL